MKVIRLLIAVFFTVIYNYSTGQELPTAHRNLPDEIVAKNWDPKNKKIINKNPPKSISFSKINQNCIDELEPNSDPGAATIIDGTSYTNNSLCLQDEDEDWFSFQSEGILYYFRIYGFEFSSPGEYGVTFSLEKDIISIETYSVNGVDPDTKIALYNENFHFLFEDDDGGSGNFSKLTYRINIPDLTLSWGQFSDSRLPIISGFLDILNVGNRNSLAESEVIFYLIKDNEFYTDLISYQIPILQPNQIYRIDFSIDILNACGRDTCVESGEYKLAFDIDRLQISGEENYTNNFYEFTRIFSIDLEDLKFECNDISEPNNDFTEAKFIDDYLDETGDLCITSGDEDWFYFDYEGERFFVKIEGNSLFSVGYYSLSYQIENDLLSIQIYPLFGEGFIIDVFLFDEELNLLAERFSNSYSESSLRYQFPCYDFLEPNDMPTEATEILEPNISLTSLCMGENDVDWFFFLNKGSKYYLSISGLRIWDTFNGRFYQGDYELSTDLEMDILNVAVKTIEGEIGNLFIKLYDEDLGLLQSNYLGNDEYSNSLTYSFFDIIYVNHANASSSSKLNGSSWRQAFSHLQDAIAIADSGDQIWISKGIYFPTLCTSCETKDRNISFQLPQYVDLIGGFNGDEVSIQERRTDSISLFHMNATILSGEIGSPEKDEDNSRSILLINEIDDSGPITFLDGLIIEEGYIEEDFDSFDLGNIFVPRGINLKFSNCIFRNNRNYTSVLYRVGGVIYLEGRGNFFPLPKISFQNCFFENNSGRSLISTHILGLNISDCKFDNNEGGIFRVWNDDDDIGFGQTAIQNCQFKNSKSIGLFRGPTDLLISNTIFKNIAENGINLDLVRGGIIDSTLFINIGGEVISYLSPLSYLNDGFPIDGIFENVDTLRISNSKFIDSDSIAINFNYGRLELINSNLDNSRIKTGNADLFILNCLFHDTFKTFEKAGEFGGAIENINSNSEIISSTFINNQIQGGFTFVNQATVPFGGGGAIYNKNGNHYCANCTFEKNVSSGKGGGAIYSDEADVIIQESYFLNNRATGFDNLGEILPGNGGAIYCANGNTLIDNSIFEDNSATGIGGGFWLGVTDEGIFNQNHIENCEVLNNHSEASGGGGYLLGPSNVLGSHFSNNLAENGGGLTVDGPISVIGSTISNNLSNSTGGGVLSSGKVEFTNCTIYGNHSAEGGGGIFCDRNTFLFDNPEAELTETTLDILSIKYSTIYLNYVNSNGNNIQLNIGDTLILKNSLLAGDGPSISTSEGSYALSEGYNLISDTSASNFRAQSTDIVGSSIEPIDPRLDSLKMNGGPVPTLALLAYSPAISSGEFIDSTSTTTDQRGYSRVIGSSNNRIDIGAYEYQESKIFAPEIQVCQFDDESFILRSIILTDSTGGGWAIGENQSLILRFPKGILIQDNPKSRVEAIGEGITLVYYEIGADKIAITYNREYTTQPNQILIENLTIKLDLPPGNYSLLRTTEGNSIQFGNNPQDSISHAGIWVFPSISSNSLPYDDSFEQETSIWQPHEGNSLWELGSPSGSTINYAQDGERVWATDLDDAYSTNVHAWLYSPCFDLSSLPFPMLSFDLWSDTQAAFDGAVLQVSTDNGNNWYSFGTDTSGINWYDLSTLIANPGDQPEESQYGWSGEYLGWKRVAHRLVDSLVSPITRFRLAFKSIGIVNAAADLNGVAIDNFFLGNKSRKILLEYFPGAISEGLSQGIPKAFEQYKDDIIPISYHYQSGDPLEAANSIDPQARLSHYSISTPGNIVVGGMEYQGSLAELSLRTIDTSSLEFSPFHIYIDTTSKDPYTVKATLTALQKWDRPLRIHIALLEDGVSMGGKTYNHVLRKMLPGAQGERLQNMDALEPMFIEETWTPNSQPSPSIVQNPDSLYAVVFIQDAETQEIYQASKTDKRGNLITNVSDPIGMELAQGQAKGIHIYPNPASNYLWVVSPEGNQESIVLRLSTIQGQVVASKEIRSKELEEQWGLPNLPSGVYIFEALSKGSIFKRDKIAIVNP